MRITDRSSRAYTEPSHARINVLGETGGSVRVALIFLHDRVGLGNKGEKVNGMTYGEATLGKW